MTQEELKIGVEITKQIRDLDSEIEELQKYLNEGSGFCMTIRFSTYDKNFNKKDRVFNVKRDAAFCKSFISERLNIAMGERHQLQTMFENL
jgi:ribosomal protein L29